MAQAKLNPFATLFRNCRSKIAVPVPKLPSLFPKPISENGTLVSEWNKAFLRGRRPSQRQPPGGRTMSDNLLDQHPVGSPEWCWLNGYGDMKESAKLSNLSEDSLKRNHADKIVRLGPRRLGMKRYHALSLGKPLAG
jgi:hypothetical protein